MTESTCLATAATTGDRCRRHPRPNGLCPVHQHWSHTSLVMRPERCITFRPGHHVHPVQAARAHENPEDRYDGLVIAVHPASARILISSGEEVFAVYNHDVVDVERHLEQFGPWVVLQPDWHVMYSGPATFSVRTGENWPCHVL